MVLGNINAPRAVSVSAILYCLRCLVKQSIPLNEVKIYLLMTRDA
jgi:5-oxoprolinase (ATP-hydrolysing)